MILNKPSAAFAALNLHSATAVASASIFDRMLEGIVMGGTTSKPPCKGAPVETKERCRDEDNNIVHKWCTTGDDCLPQCHCGEPNSSSSKAGRL